MSRGPGRIERAIRALFDTHPDEAFITDELCEHCYPDARLIERKHQVATLRAAWNVIKDDPDWQVWLIPGMGHGYVFVNLGNVESYTLGHLIASNGTDIIYRSEKRARRRPFEWARAGPGMRAKLPVPWERQYVPNRKQLLALDAGSSRRVAEGRVADHIAYRDGDAEVRATVQAKWNAEQEYGRRLLAAALGTGPPDKRYQAADVGDSETLSGETIPPTDASRLAAKARALMVENDPDVIRAGLAEIAEVLEQQKIFATTSDR